MRDMEYTNCHIYFFHANTKYFDNIFIGNINTYQLILYMDRNVYMTVSVCINYKETTEWHK
jgi:hypothetical protein